MKQLFISVTAAILLAGCAGMDSGAGGRAGADFSDPTADIYLGF